MLLELRPNEQEEAQEEEEEGRGESRRSRAKMFLKNEVLFGFILVSRRFYRRFHTWRAARWPKALSDNLVLWLPQLKTSLSDKSYEL